MEALNILVYCMTVTETELAKAQQELEELSRARTRATTLADRTAQVQRIKEDVGKISYPDLTLLLEIGYAAFGVTKTMGIDAVKHLVKRARNRRKERAERPLPFETVEPS
jgi:hypothetical protein